MPDIYKKITELQQSNVPAALVTVTKAKGSTPRNAGAKMIVQMDGTIFGTVGGSSVEAQVIEEAKECINKNVCRTVSHNLYDLEKNAGVRTQSDQDESTPASPHECEPVF